MITGLLIGIGATVIIGGGGALLWLRKALKGSQIGSDHP